MLKSKIRVGIIGANPDRGWAAAAHVPALLALPEYTIEAVATRHRATAEAAAARFGAPWAFTDPRRLAEHPDVDLVVVTVKVPFHAELVQTGLAAGKPVHCEWPLARTTAEAEQLVEAATRAGVATSVGFQGRFAPEIRFARELLIQGYVGRVNAVTVLASNGRGTDGQIPAESAYTLDRTNGAGLVEVMGGHTLDVVRYLVGEFEQVDARLGQRRHTYTVAETGKRFAATSPDQLALQAPLSGGGILSLHLHVAKVTQPRTRIEIAGTEGDLVMTTLDLPSPLASLVQIGNLRLQGAQGGAKFADLPVPDRFWPSGSGAEGNLVSNAVGNVMTLYRALATSLRPGEANPAGQAGPSVPAGPVDLSVPDFEHAVRMHHLLDTIRGSWSLGSNAGPLVP